MKKLLLLFVAAIISFQMASAQTMYNRRVMVEEFTQASCGPCAAQNPAFNAAIDANYDKVSPVKYQVWWPGFDPMYLHNTADVDNRVAYYDVSGVPDAFQNGTTDVSPGSYNANLINSGYNNMTPVKIELSHEWDQAYENVTITVDVTSETAISGDLRLRIAVTEHEILFTSAPGSNGEKDFYDVMKKMLPSADGTMTGDFAAGETKSYTFEWRVEKFYDFNQLQVVAWLQDDATKEVWQSEISEPSSDVVDGGNFASVKVNSLLANQFSCDGSAAPIVLLKNVGTDPLTSATFKYVISGQQDALTMDWTGNLGPNQTTSVNIPEINFTESGFYTVDITVKNTNQGVQTNQINATATISVFVNLEGKMLPVADDFESGTFPADGWGVLNEDGQGWELSDLAGGFGTSTSSIICPFYSIQEGTANVYLPLVDLATANGISTLTFEHAHCYYSSTLKDDRLKIEVSTNCGLTWNTIWDKMGDDLATKGPQTNGFVPTANQWVTNEVDLSNYNGQDIMIRFQAISGYGNNLWVDNVNVSTTVSNKQELLPLSEFKVIPNPTASVSQIRFDLEQADDLTLSVFNNLGVLVSQKQLGTLVAGQHMVDLNAITLPNGNYRVVLQGANGIATRQWVVLK